MLPPKTLKAFKSASAMTGAGQHNAADAQTLRECDILKCGLKVPGGTSIEGYVCVKEGPLFGKTCDATMMQSLVLVVSYWRRSRNYMFHVESELLDTSEPPAYLPLADVNWLSTARGRCRETNTARLNECLLGESSRRAFGNRTVAFGGVQKLIAGMMVASPLLTEDYNGALGLTRKVVGAAKTRDIGRFVVCTNQQSAPWGTSVQCFCHLELDGGVDSALLKKLDTRTRCLESMKPSGKSGGKKRSNSSSSKTDKTAKEQAKAAKLVVL